MKTTGAFVVAGMVVLLMATSASVQGVPSNGIAAEDKPYLLFGKVIQATTQANPNWKDPHHVSFPVR